MVNLLFSIHGRVSRGPFCGLIPVAAASCFRGPYSASVVFRSCATSINFRRRRSSAMPK
jgi:hypothetical protein